MGAGRWKAKLRRASVGEAPKTEEERRLVKMRTAAASDGVDAATLSAACEELANLARELADGKAALDLEVSERRAVQAQINEIEPRHAE